jgi:LuxR family maltose regulon positive regulatory protein
LEARTEGWISGLKLAAISLHQHQNPETFIASFTGSHHFVQDYLIEEVLHQQPAEVQAFLLRTSVLDRLCGPLCDAVLQGQGGEKILHQLEQAGLFVVPLDSERRWYRYHHLFADLLRQRLGHQEAAGPLHRRATRWYEMQGLELEAFHQATQAQHMGDAMRLIEGKGMPLYFRGVTAPVVQWLSSLTPAALTGHPFLWVAFSWSLLFAGHPAQVEEKLLAAEAALRSKPHDARTADTQGQIAVLRAWLAVYRNEADAIHAQACHALALLNPENRPARTAAHCALGVAQMFRGERAAASAAFSAVIGAGVASGNVMFSTVAATALAGIQVTDYQLHAAAATYREAIRMVGDPSHVLGFEARLGLANIMFEWNALDEADALAVQCRELVDLAKSRSEIGADLLQARLLSARGAYLQADALLVSANASNMTGPLTDRQREAADLHLHLMLRQGHVDAAAAVARAHQLPLGLARTLLAQGQAAQALETIQDHRRTMESERRTQDALKAMVLEVRILHAVGAVDQALLLLRACVRQAQPQGSIRLFADEGAPMQALLVQLLEEADTAHHVSQLLVAFGLPVTQPRPVPAPSTASPSHLPLGVFSARELEILQLIAQGHSNQEIGERLFLSLSTVKWHNQNIFAKLDVQRRTEAVARARQLNLL